jgi:hypothetical protein
LTGKKEPQEVRIGFGNQGDTVAFLQTHTEQLARQHASLCTQLRIG